MRGRTLAVVVLFGGLTVAPAEAITIAAARALPLGTPVTIDNVIITSTTDLIAAPGSRNFQIQDATGAMSVFGTNAIIAAIIGNVGDRITLSGTTGTSRGLFQLVGPFSLISNVPDVAPPPSLTDVPDYQDFSPTAEGLESKVAVLPNVTFTTPGVFAVSNFFVTDTSGTLLARVRIQTAANPLIGTPIPAGPVTLRGIFYQFDSVADSIDQMDGYELQLRDLSDVVTAPDCNQNGLDDACDLTCVGPCSQPACGLSSDCNSNGLPDECESDCNHNNIADPCEGLPDCDSNGLPDLCETLFQSDCNLNGIPDHCEALADCNSDGVPDTCETFLDCNTNGLIDSCEFSFSDCNSNGLPDLCEFEADCNTNGILDACEPIGEPDCNGNGLSDRCENYTDCNGNSIADFCEPGGGDDCNQNGLDDFLCEAMTDCDLDGVGDACQAVGDSDCNNNAMLDACEIVIFPGTDANLDGVLDVCAAAAVPCAVPGDMNGDGLVNGKDIRQYVACILSGFAGPGCACADLNGTPGYQPADLALFVAILLGTGGPAPCTIDLAIDSNNNGKTFGDYAADNPIEENAPGKKLGMNDDDDDANGTADLSDPERMSPAAGGKRDNDLVPIILRPVCVATGRKWSLTFPNRIKIWRLESRSNMTTPVTAPMVSGQLRDFPMPETFWVEGLSPSTQPADVEILLEVKPMAGGAAVASDKVKATVVKLEVLNAANAAAEFLNIGHFGADGGGGTLDGYTGAGDLKNDNMGTFIDNDPDRFRVRVTDASANTNAASRQIIKVAVDTLTSADAADDNATEIELQETGNNTGIFLSEDLLLCSPNLPTRPDDDIAVHSVRAGAAVNDDMLNDRTHRVNFDGKVHVKYTLSPENASERTIPVCRRTPDDRRTLTYNARVYLEPFQDTGYDHDGNAMTPNIGAGNGMFDFTDAGGMNGMHDASERSEAYMDMSSGAGVFRNGNDPAVKDGRGAIAPDSYLSDQLSRSNIGWAQGCIRITQNGGTTVVAAPKVGGVDVIADGVFNYPADVIEAVKQIGAGAAVGVVEVIYPGPVQGANAIAFPPAHNDAIKDFPGNRKENSYIAMRHRLPLTARTLAHEFHHVLANGPDQAVPDYIFAPNTKPLDDGLIKEYRRFRHDWETRCRTVRAAGNLTADGNRLLTTP